MKLQSDNLSQYQKEVKPLTYQQMMAGVHNNLKSHNIIHNPDRWSLKKIVGKDMFPIIPLLRWVDNLFESPITIGLYYGVIVICFVLMCLFAF